SYVPLSKVYSFDPVPAELSPDEAKYIIGGQGNVWTEYIATPEKAEYMVFPRAIALAEAVWSPLRGKDFADFTRRLGAQLPRLDKQNVNYRIPEPGGLHNVVAGGDGPIEIQLTPPFDGAKIYYTVDGAAPDEKSKLYDAPITIDLKKGERTELKTIVTVPNGRKSSIYAATIIRGELLPAAAVDEKKPGVKYEFAVPNDDPAKATVTRGESKSIQLQQFGKTADLKQPFGVTYEGYLDIPTDGVYELQIDSTWDAALVFDGQMVIDDVGTKDRKVRSAIVPLKAGLHKISLRYNHHGGDAGFRFRYGIKGQGLRQAYGGEFFH
ncbi:MAG TPA: family 20 glycosylhydrolase, partial [Pyrinomonadaceae bacterium]|nr:family 20 glycosylhydrolase [Pyrinomonadaceae bacterium]